MVNALFNVQHGHCALCGRQDPLYVLNLAPNEYRLERLAPGTHTGVCADCWIDVAATIRYELAYEVARRMT